ncbi:hypothetical protein ANCDUO_06902 [Ancylostoma duodenale]|uniref:Uncharacterized protein n=1 Tax=Ancylostoma duodenale TaxID=51022 RepID=A0A0C2DJZ6_9BILA|nr:hypothetical protein ANCDUO_06902 [Ancylostoma duodenale]
MDAMNEGARRISEAAPFVGPPRSSARSRSLSAIQASLPPLPPPVRCGEVACEVLESTEPCTSSTSTAEVPNDAEEDLLQDEDLECYAELECAKLCK